MQGIDRVMHRRCEIGGVCCVHPRDHFVDEHGNGCGLLGGEFARHTESEVVKNIDVVQVTSDGWTRRCTGGQRPHVRGNGVHEIRACVQQCGDLIVTAGAEVLGECPRLG